MLSNARKGIMANTSTRERPGVAMQLDTRVSVHIEFDEWAKEWPISIFLSLFSASLFPSFSLFLFAVCKCGD